MGFVSEPVNPGGVACWGFVAYRDGERLFEGKGVIGEGRGMSNNLAEYTALCMALKELLEHKLQGEEVVVRSDSQLLVNQMNGWWQVHGGLYYPAYAEAVRLSQFFHPKISFAWIPREENEEADLLSRQAYEEYCKSKGAQPKYHDSLPRENRKMERKTCLTCKWVMTSGPHIGCWRDGKYQRWIPKKFAMNKSCPYYEEKPQGEV